MEKEKRKQEKALRKKAYEKPCIVHQQSLEVVAGVCEVPGGKATYPVAPCTTVNQS
jgi:hypothetical protein